MRINNNLMAMNTHRQLSINSGNGAKSIEKLSSGFRINRAGDDAAGLAISEKMRGQIRGLGQASRNAQDGISMIQTAEGALNETHAILQRMRELAVQSSTDTNTVEDRTKLQSELDQLTSEITRISTATEFNTKKLLNGDMGKTFATTANTFGASNIQITGSDITTGTYTLTKTAAGTDTFTIGTNTASAALGAGDISAAAGSLYGNYSLQVTNFGATADVALTGPDNTVTSISGVALNADLTIGGITFGFATGAAPITSAGTIAFSLTANGLDVDLSGAKTVVAAPIAAYAGETLNVGGFEFTVRTGSGANGTVNTMNVTDNAVKFHIGANSDQNTSLSINKMDSTALGIDSLIITTQSGANNAITTINDALESVSEERAKLGAMQNRLEHTIKNLDTSAENLQASESRIRDVDMAKEMMEFTKNNILQQAAQAMLAQANQAPQGVLQLLR
jgi:flagellin